MTLENNLIGLCMLSMLSVFIVGMAAAVLRGNGLGLLAAFVAPFLFGGLVGLIKVSFG